MRWPLTNGLIIQWAYTSRLYTWKKTNKTHYFSKTGGYWLLENYLVTKSFTKYNENTVTTYRFKKDLKALLLCKWRGGKSVIKAENKGKSNVGCECKRVGEGSEWRLEICLDIVFVVKEHICPFILNMKLVGYWLVYSIPFTALLHSFGIFFYWRKFQKFPSSTSKLNESLNILP